MTEHMADGLDLRGDGEGWLTARCTCGWRQGPWPDAETMVDALMGHAILADRAERSAAVEGRGPTKPNDFGPDLVARQGRP